MNELMTLFVVVIVVGIQGILLGSFMGESRLCTRQFQGEMRDGKCIRVTIEALTIEPKASEATK